METFLTVLFGGLVALVIFEFFRIGLHMHKAKQLGKKAAFFSREHPRARERILIIGDSTSLGTGATRPEYSLAGRLGNDMPESTIVNASKNALNAKGVLEEIQKISDGRFDRVFIHLGGIDTLTLTPIEKLKKYLGEIFGKAKKMSSGSVVLVSVNNVGVAPAFRFPVSRFYTRRSRQLSSLFKEMCAEHGVRHIDLFEEKENDSFLTDPRRFYAEDGVHPSDEGYAIWYEKIKAGL